MSPRKLCFLAVACCAGVAACQQDVAPPPSLPRNATTTPVLTADAAVAPPTEPISAGATDGGAPSSTLASLRTGPSELAPLYDQFWNLASAALQEAPLPEAPFPVKDLSAPTHHVTSSVEPGPLDAIQPLALLLEIEVIFRRAGAANSVHAILLVTPNWHEWTRLEVRERRPTWAHDLPAGAQALQSAVVALQHQAATAQLQPADGFVALGVPARPRWLLPETGVAAADQLLAQQLPIDGFYLDDIFVIARGQPGDLLLLHLDIDSSGRSLYLDARHPLVRIRDY